MTDFAKALMIDGTETYVNIDSIIHIDLLKDYLAIHFADDTIMNVNKKCLKNFFELKK